MLIIVGRQFMFIVVNFPHRINQLLSKTISLTPAGDVLDRGRDRNDCRVVQRAGFNPVWRGGILGAQAVGRQEIQQAGPGIKNSDMRPIEFIRRAKQEIGIHGLTSSAICGA